MNLNKKYLSSEISLRICPSWYLNTHDTRKESVCVADTINVKHGFKKHTECVDMNSVSSDMARVVSKAWFSPPAP